MKYSAYNRKGGFTLFYAVLISSLLLAIGLAILNITLKEFTLSSGARDSETAFYAADSALECALYWDNAARPFGYYGDSLANDLVAYWRFEETSAQQSEDPPIILDSSGSGRYGVAVGGPTWTPDGILDQGLVLDGLDDYVKLPTITLPDDFTISFWARPALTFPAPGTAANDFVIGGPTERFGFRMDSTTGLASYRLVTGGTTAKNMAMTPTLSYDWHYFALRRSVGKIELFVDGTGSSIDFGTGYSASFSFTKLGQQETGTWYYEGGLDDFRVYDRALSTTEIDAIRGFDLLAGFVQPLDTDDPLGGSIECAGDNINNSDGWWLHEDQKTTGWLAEDLSTNKSDPLWRTTFDVRLPNNTCGLVQVFKSGGTNASTTVISRGYNTCDLSNSRTLERAIRAQY